MDDCINILHIEDCRSDALLVERTLRKGEIAAKLNRVDDLKALVTALDSDRWHVVISDYRIPGLAFEDVLSAIREAQQGLPRKIDPLVLCSYEIDCEDVVDLTNPNVRLGLSISPADLSGGWLLSAQSGETPSSWEVAKRLIASDVAGVIVPSFAPGAATDDRNLVLWRWGPDLPCQVSVHDPSNRLPKNALSWS